MNTDPQMSVPHPKTATAVTRHNIPKAKMSQFGELGAILVPVRD